MRSLSGDSGRARPSFFMALTRIWKSLSNPKLYSDSAFRSCRLITDNEPSPNSRSDNEIPARVPINVESMAGQSPRSTMNSRAPRWIISSHSWGEQSRSIASNDKLPCGGTEPGHPYDFSAELRDQHETVQRIACLS
jgi:hypothetical protein